MAQRQRGWGGAAVILLVLLGGLVTAGTAGEVTSVVTPPGASNVPGGITVDADGNLYSADFGGSVVYRVTPDGDVSVFTQGLLTPSGNAFDSRGRYYQSNYQDPASPNAADTIVRVNRKGAASVFASGLQGPVGIAIDGNDVLYVAMCNAPNQVWRVDVDGTATPFVSSSLFNCPNGITFDDVGDLFVVSFNNGIVARITPDGSVTNVATLPGGGNGHVVYVAGSLYITDRSGHRVYEVILPRREGGPYKVKALVGTGAPGSADGPADTASLQAPNGIARNARGDMLYVNQTGGLIRAISLDLRRPAKPNKVRLQAAGNDAVVITWSDRDRREEYFEVQRLAGKGSDFETVARVGWNTTTVRVDGLVAGTRYQFRVVAGNGTAQSRPSRKVRFTAGNPGS